MLAPGAGMEILGIGSVELVKALHGIFHRVRMDHVEDHGNAHAMGGLYQGF